LSGHIDNVAAWEEYCGRARVTFSEYHSPYLEVYFNDKKVVDGRLSHLAPGTKMTIEGQPDYVSRSYMSLKNCKIVSVALPEIPESESHA
jgi:hypothetical protein